MHTHGVSEEDPAVVPRRPSTDHLLDFVEAVGLPICDEAERLDKYPDVLQLLSTHKVQRMVGAPFEQIYNVLTPAPGHRQEGDVANAEAAMAVDGAMFTVLAGKHRVVPPRISKAALVEARDEHVQQHLRRYWRDGLVDEPTAEPGRGQVLPPCNQVNLLYSIFHARPDVLDRECSITKDCCTVTLQVVVRHIVIHAVANLEVGFILARIIDYPWIEVSTWEVVENARCLLEALCTLLHGFDGEGVAAVKVLQFPVDVHVLHIVPEGDVGQDAVPLGSMLHVRNDFVLLWPGAPLFRVAEARVVTPLHAEPYVERPQLRLQPRGLVCLMEPGMATDSVIPVVHVKIIALLMLPEKCMLDTAVACANEYGRVRPLVWLGLEGLDAFDRGHTGDFVSVALDPPAAALLRHDCNVVRAHHCLAGNSTLHIEHFRANLHRDGQRLGAVNDLQCDILEAAAVNVMSFHTVAPCEGKTFPVPIWVEDVKAKRRHLTNLLLSLLAHLEA
mmetsp:Transcript_64053/g.177715  ORF Transcript_64053/g.177715 Transcript_64053/m.177715 type:complete len:502 (+) Transcript_64053:1025-2530(+)